MNHPFTKWTKVACSLDGKDGHASKSYHSESMMTMKSFQAAEATSLESLTVFCLSSPSRSTFRLLPNSFGLGSADVSSGFVEDGLLVALAAALALASALWSHHVHTAAAPSKSGKASWNSDAESHQLATSSVV